MLVLLAESLVVFQCLAYGENIAEAHHTFTYVWGVRKSKPVAEPPWKRQSSLPFRVDRVLYWPSVVSAGCSLDRMFFFAPTLENGERRSPDVPDFLGLLSITPRGPRFVRVVEGGLCVFFIFPCLIFCTPFLGRLFC